jgi:hypothetical protein
MSKLIPPSIILLGLLLFCQIPASSAAQSIVLTDEVQMTLGKAFMAEGDYYRAITEYKKLIFLFPDSGHLPSLLQRKGLRVSSKKLCQSSTNLLGKPFQQRSFP